MITRIFLKLTDYPVFRRGIWKPVYEILAKRIRVRNWSFMNYGYAPLKNEPLLALDMSDEINRYPVQLYHYLATKTEIAGRKVLEVGSGRGGGASYIKKYLHPESITGLDIAFHAVKLANEHYGNMGIQFIQGNAEKLPFESGRFDVVINVESSHAYGSVPNSLSEVKRVLCSGGFFLCADLRTSLAMKTLKQEIISSGMELVSSENISENVIYAIELEEQVKQQRIRDHIPSWIRKTFKEFAGVKGSKAHKNLICGELVYYRFVMRKLVD